jgi:hypothetical protein
MLNPNSDIAPIFVIGSARAGTSALVAALRDAARIPTDNEGHLVSMTHALLRASREHVDAIRAQGSTIERVGSDRIEEAILEAVRRMQESAFPGVLVWLDKTPDGPSIRAIPYIMRMWPKARFIYAKRRGIENIVSRMRKFPHLSFTEHCERWSIAMNLWKERKVSLPAGSWIEIEQREMALQPERTAHELGAFLGFSDATVQAVAHTFATTRPESTGSNEKVSVSIDSVGWSRAQIYTYQRICGHVATEWGYSEDENYYSR